MQERQKVKIYQKPFLEQICLYQKVRTSLWRYLGCPCKLPQYSHRLQDMVIDMLSEYKTTINRLKGIEKQLSEFVEGCESGRILLSIPGIGVINASAFLASIDKGQAFSSPKEFAVWGYMPQAT